MDINFDQTIIEAIEKSIDLIDSGEIKRGKELLNMIKEAINCLSLIKLMSADD